MKAKPDYVFKRDELVQMQAENPLVIVAAILG
jgi:hypothetical protein